MIIDRLTTVLKNRRIELLSMTKVGRNDPCPCGSGKKYKKCCWLSDMKAKQQLVAKQPSREAILTPQKRQKIIDENQPVLETLERVVNEGYKQNPSLTGTEIIKVYQTLLGVLTRRVEGSEERAAIERLSPRAREIHDTLKDTIMSVDENLYPDTNEPTHDVPEPRERPSAKGVPIIADCLSVLIDSAKFWTREGGAQGYLNYVSNFFP